MNDITTVVETTFINKRKPDRSPFGPCYTGSCPWCGGTDRFHVYPDGGDIIPGIGNLGRFHCMDSVSGGRAGCGRKGDMVSYIEQRRDLRFNEACEELGIEPQLILMYRLSRRVQILEEKGVAFSTACYECNTAPDVIEDYRKNNIIPDTLYVSSWKRERSLSESSEAWRTTALELVQYATSQLQGEALEYVLARGVSRQSIVTNLLGFYPQYKRVKPDFWGYQFSEEARDRGEKQKREIWIPRGIVIPWFDEHNRVLCIRFRRLPSDTSEQARKFYGVDETTGEINRYKAMYGSSSHLFYQGWMLPSENVALFEGEFTALVAQQCYPDYRITCLATGSTAWGRNDRNIRLLAASQRVLVCFDNDRNRAGDKASAYWTGQLKNARRWCPLWGDANDMALDGADVGAWLAIGIGDEPGITQDVTQAESMPVADDEIPDILAKCDDCGVTAPEIMPEDLNDPAYDLTFYFIESAEVGKFHCYCCRCRDGNGMPLPKPVTIDTVLSNPVVQALVRFAPSTDGKPCEVELLRCTADEYIAQQNPQEIQRRHEAEALNRLKESIAARRERAYAK